MFSPLALILIPLGYLFLWPFTDWLLRRGGRTPQPLRVALTAVALSIGILSMVLIWIGLLPGEFLTPLVALLVVLIGLGIGIALNRTWFNPARWLAYWRVVWNRLRALDIESLLLWTMIGSLFLIAIHALYYPFIGDDTLSRYGLQAQTIYRAGRIPESLWGYPPLAPLSYTATWFAAGGPNEHLAKLFPVLMATGMLGATLLLGRRAGERPAGLLAAAIVALTPMFIRNATLAYTDIPATFPLMMAALYAYLWWDEDDLQHVWLAGVMLGIALLAKQSALIGAASLAAVPLLWAIHAYDISLADRARRAGGALLGILLPALLIAGPWYVRNALIAGWENILPVAGAFHQASVRPNWLEIIPSLAWSRDFGVPLAFLYALGWLFGLALAARQGVHLLLNLDRAHVGPPPDLFMLAFVLPYWLTWWLRFSFEARFLLLILPFMAIWSASLLALVAEYTLPVNVRVPRVVQVGLSVAILGGLLFIGARDRLGGLYYAVTDPFASDADRLRRNKNELIDLAMYIQDNIDPADASLMAMDGRIVYYLPDYDIEVRYPLKLRELEDVDYLVHASSVFNVYDDTLGWEDSEFYRHIWDERVFQPIYESGGVHIMHVLRTTPPPKD